VKAVEGKMRTRSQHKDERDVSINQSDEVVREGWMQADGALRRVVSHWTSARRLPSSPSSVQEKCGDPHATHVRSHSTSASFGPTAAMTLTMTLHAESSCKSWSSVMWSDAIYITL
jgi:hypothetical protein